MDKTMNRNSFALQKYLPNTKNVKFPASNTFISCSILDLDKAFVWQRGREQAYNMDNC